ncbi:hypothetical protein LWI29_018306 [Acer saccharum]|uniref:DUF4219 domain-containing protein n=1 Tax=Acer saccharum TaxID=4024 RepID=A0AA39RDG3_ACESA|nr:hypothetical protein LWI29_018306 [Acer saccharum]
MVELLPEGASSARPPLLDSGNYTFWRNTMKAFIRAFNDKSWMSVSDVVEEEESLNDRESTSNYIAHVAIYEGRFEDSSEESSCNEESDNSSSSEDSEISSNQEEFEASSNQDYISFNDKILQQKNEENNKLKLINANLVVIFKALVNEKKMSLEKMSKQSEVIKEHEKTIEKYVSKVEDSAQELDDLKEDFTMKLFAMEEEIKQKENSLSIMKIKECELKDEVKSLKESINGMKIGAIKLDEVIKLGKHHGDMTGLGFVEEVKKTPTTKNKSRKSKKKKDSTTIPSNIKDKDKKSYGTSQPTSQPNHAHPKVWGAARTSLDLLSISLTERRLALVVVGLVNGRGLIGFGFGFRFDSGCLVCVRGRW